MRYVFARNYRDFSSEFNNFNPRSDHITTRYDAMCDPDKKEDAIFIDGINSIKGRSLDTYDYDNLVFMDKWELNPRYDLKFLDSLVPILIYKYKDDKIMLNHIWSILKKIKDKER